MLRFIARERVPARYYGYGNLDDKRAIIPRILRSEFSAITHTYYKQIKVTLIFHGRTTRGATRRQNSRMRETSGTERQTVDEKKKKKKERKERKK